MKQLLKRILFGAAPWQAHATVGLRDPSRVTRVVLDGLGERRDVSDDHVPVSLRPLTIGLCLDASETPATDLRLTLEDWDDGSRVRGRIWLRPQQSIALPSGRHRLWICEVMRSSNGCLAPLHMYAREARDAWHRRGKPNPYNFTMSVDGLRALNVYYMRPRPVSFVTVIDGGASDLFPMDLIGPVSSGQFLMALRSTSPAIPLMRSSRRLAVSALPAAFKQAAYALGKHHERMCVDWAALPFATLASPEFGLPVPRDALFVRELEIQAVHSIHSHTFFVTDVVRQTLMGDGPAFCHMAGPCVHARHIEVV
jgi:flavin reductase (DIM6/NTAB) family NADH-FMN oxidoreductase RutF